MARLVLGLGTSHTPMLLSEAEDWEKFAERDTEGKFLNKAGVPTPYEELIRQADPRMAEWIRPEVLAARFDQSQAGVHRIAETLQAAKLDALIVIGDDQTELFHTDNLPALLIYYGETILNRPRHMDNPNKIAWFQAARGGYYEAETSEGRDYPVRADLARHLIAELIDNEFDVSSAGKLLPGQGEGHAFGFVHKRLMDDYEVAPIIPVCLNTYYPPNQPTPRRCYKIGQAIRAAVESFPQDLRVGILASGGLSHFTVDAEFDEALLEAMRTKDGEMLSSVDRKKLNSGSSEIRNWICVAGAVEHLDMQWSEYLPCYRTEAGTGTGVGFAAWS